MGKKITVDCATMINKGFEVIEASWLFNCPLSKIKVVLHRESIIHSMVRFKDNSIIAQMGNPSMEIPISLAVTGERLPVSTPALDFTSLLLTFGTVDKDKYPCFYLALKCAEMGDNYPCVLNAVNEVAVNSFLEGKIKFTDIYKIIDKVVSLTERVKITSYSVLESCDMTARQVALKCIGELNV